jgi:hypothetical protein
MTGEGSRQGAKRARRDGPSGHSTRTSPPDVVKAYRAGAAVKACPRVPRRPQNDPACAGCRPFAICPKSQGSSWLTRQVSNLRRYPSRTRRCLLVCLVVGPLPFGHVFTRAAPVRHHQALPGQPPSAMVVARPTAAWAPDSSHALQSLRLPSRGGRPGLTRPRRRSAESKGRGLHGPTWGVGSPSRRQPDAGCRFTWCR